jgi:hypothetical protein
MIQPSQIEKQEPEKGKIENKREPSKRGKRLARTEIS